MALQLIPGFGPSIWYPPVLAVPPALSNHTAIAATGEKFAYCGRVWLPGHGTKNVERLGVRIGALTDALSGWTMSLQDVILTAGAPMQPDETQDQTVAVSAEDVTASTWLRTGPLSANRTITHGDLLAIVTEYDGLGRLGTDSLTLSGLTANTNQLQCVPVVKTGGSWATAGTIVPNVILEMSDGTFGTLDGAIPVSAVNSHAFKQDTGTADEFSLAFQVPFTCKTDGFYFPVLLAANTSDFSFILYDGTTPMTGGTVTVDANSVSAVTSSRIAVVSFSQEITLTINHTYYLACQPTQTTSNVTVYSLDVANANHLTCHPGGPNWNYTARLNVGPWDGVTTTRRLVAGLRISSLDDGVSAGGGGIAVLTGGGLAR